MFKKNLTIPKVIGHRGAKGYAPENTIPSIRTAADLGAKWVELDVKLTRDNVPVIFHDEELERCTGMTGLMAETNYADIRGLDAGSWYGESFAGTRIPTLEEAVDVIFELGLGLNLEIKPCPGREKDTAEIAIDYLSRIWDERDNLLISSFQHVSLEAARDLAPDMARGLLLDDAAPLLENWKELADYLDVSTINVGRRLVTRELADEVMDMEKPLLVYTVNDPMEARRLQQLGVDSFFSDVPDVILENLAKVH